LLGAIIERVAGQAYQRYVTERVLQPASMTRTTFHLSVVRGLPDVAVLYAARDEAGRKEMYAAPQGPDAPAMAAGGYLRSCLRDVLCYLEIYRTGGRVGVERILSRASVEAMTHP